MGQLKVEEGLQKPMKICSSRIDCKGARKQKQGAFASHEAEHASTQRRGGEAADPPGYRSCHAAWLHHGWMPAECHNNRWEARMRLNCVKRQERLRVLATLQIKDPQICPDPGLFPTTHSFCWKAEPNPFLAESQQSWLSLGSGRSSNLPLYEADKWINQAVKVLASSSLLGSRK